MAIMTGKMLQQLYDLQCTSAGLPTNLRKFLGISIRGIYATAESFDTRKELQEYIDTLADLISTEVSSR